MEAIISMHIYEEDKAISVRLHANNRYELCFGYYDDEDEFFRDHQDINRRKRWSSEATPESNGKSIGG